ncbi:MAG: TRAP transporter small permease subunit [Gammaproteobacteria bacterium]|nr:TRAP transporter small permease subunit [Gammaproteobacteria bacterium]
MDQPSYSGIARFADMVDSLNENVGRAISWFTLLMVLVTFLVVVLRYLFNIGWIAMQESVTYMHAAVFMLGAAYTMKHGGHVRVDLIYRGLSPRKKAWVDLFGSLLLLLPVCGFITWVSWEYIAASWSVWETSQEAGGIPAVFLLKTVILVMSVLMVLQGISQFLRSLLRIMDNTEETELEAGD